MVRRGREPWEGHWDIPGGFCDAGEHPADAAVRELLEETGLRGRAVEHLGIWMDDYGQPDADGLQEITMNIAYSVELIGEREQLVAEPGEVHEARWFPLDDLPAALAFPTHVAPILKAARDASTG